MKQEQPSGGTARVWCDSVRDEGSSKLCLLGSSGLLWGGGAYLPGNAAASKVAVKILHGSRRLSLRQGLANFVALVLLQTSCSRLQFTNGVSPCLGNRLS